MPSADAAVHTHAETAIVSVINQERHRFGLRPLRRRGALHRVAEGHSITQLRFDQMGHDVGSPFGSRVRSAGRFRSVGEVIAWRGFGSGTGARSVVRAWMGSPPHRSVILDPSMRLIGVGRVVGRMGSARGVMVTADLARR